jgi:hypothetical protein
MIAAAAAQLPACNGVTALVFAILVGVVAVKIIGRKR